MKKIVLSLFVLPLLAAAAFAQESRQDVSLSGTALISPDKTAKGITQTATKGYGGLASYRFMLTPHSALEANYQFVQKSDTYVSSFNTYTIHNRMQEYSAGYVYNFNFHNFNPFLEGGGGGYFFGAIKDFGTNTQTSKSVTDIGAFYGGGIAYELSPSFDIRAEYRGIIVKTPNLTGLDALSVSRYYNISNPVIGIAYHF
ncbi:MAG TPA: outer membrane beta-barrel protein [Acidisarcina sp.]